MTQQQINNAGLTLLVSSEGFRSEAYWDGTGKVWTIGYGFTKDVRKGQHMTEEEADDRLEFELVNYEELVSRLCKVPPTDNQFSAMVCLSWNIGIGPKGFPISDVLRYHNLGRFDKAAESFSHWTTSGGVTLPGLVTRRKKEAELYLT